MTTTQMFDRAVGEYVGRCMEYVRDLPPEVQAEIVDDLRQIVAEVSAELDGNPADLLGPPARFVEELRAAAGMGPEPKVNGTARRPTLDWAAVGRIARATVQVVVPACRRLFYDLRPAGWLVRGYAVAAFIAYSASGTAHAWWLFGVFPIPRLGGSAMGGALLTLLAMVLSVAIGRRPKAGWRRLVVAALTVASAFALVATTQQLRDHSAAPAVVYADLPIAMTEVTTVGTVPIGSASLSAGAGDIVVEVASIEQAVSAYESLRAAGYEAVTLHNEMGSWEIDSPDMLYQVLLNELGFG